MSQRGLVAACLVAAMVAVAVPARSESPAPSVHWGALGYPDQERKLMAGLTLNRFTQFNGSGQQFNSTMKQTVGLNFATVTWTERIHQWTSNFTAGAGPTSNQPTEFFQNNFAHNWLLHIPSVPVGAVREDTDFMFSGSLTRWAKIGEAERAFAGVGGVTGSLYHEAFARIGVRRLPLPGQFLAVSGMGRYSQLWNGAGFQVAAQSYLAQASISLGNYSNGRVPHWELEFGASIDSGLFRDSRGNSIEKIFGTLALRFPGGRFELWNDALGRQDKGPTYGATLMFDLLAMFKLRSPETAHD